MFYSPSALYGLTHAAVVIHYLAVIRDLNDVTKKLHVPLIISATLASTMRQPYAAQLRAILVQYR